MLSGLDWLLPLASPLDTLYLSMPEYQDKDLNGWGSVDYIIRKDRTAVYIPNRQSLPPIIR
jgi:hypothetical protein